MSIEIHAFDLSGPEVGLTLAKNVVTEKMCSLPLLNAGGLFFKCP